MADSEGGNEPIRPPHDTFGAPIGRHFVLLDLIGTGAMGSVYQGAARGDAEHVAIKLLRPELSNDPEFIGRFVQERTILTRLNGRGVVKIHDMVVERNTLAIVMELMRGGSLRQHLHRRGGRLSEAEAMHVMSQVFDGLAHAHDNGVVHRDIKPENILIADDVPVVTAKITDFGISGLVDNSHLTQLTGIYGTPNYMAPDIGDHVPQSPAVDVYAAGIVLYELIEGRPPFADPNPMGVLRKHLTEAPPEPALMSAELWGFTRQLLSKDPSTRGDAASAALHLESLTTARSELADIEATAPRRSVERVATESTVSDESPKDPAADLPAEVELDEDPTLLRASLQQSESPPVVALTFRRRVVSITSRLRPSARRRPQEPHPVPEFEEPGEVLENTRGVEDSYEITPTQITQSWWTARRLTHRIQSTAELPHTDLRHPSSEPGLEPVSVSRWRRFRPSRRLVAISSIALATLVLLGALYVGVEGVSHRNGYYLAYDSAGDLVMFKGSPSSFLWIHPTRVKGHEITFTDLQYFPIPTNAHRSFPTLSEATAFLNAVTREDSVKYQAAQAAAAAGVAAAAAIQQANMTISNLKAQAVADLQKANDAYYTIYGASPDGTGGKTEPDSVIAAGDRDSMIPDFEAAQSAMSVPPAVLSAATNYVQNFVTTFGQCIAGQLNFAETLLTDTTTSPNSKDYETAANQAAASCLTAETDDSALDEAGWTITSSWPAMLTGTYSTS